MNYRLVFRLIGRLLLMEAALMLPSLAVSLIYGGGDAMAFVDAILLTVLCGGAMALLLHPKREDLNARDGMVVAGLSWATLSFFGCLPFVFSGAIPHFADAYFETVSGLTTTGATILRDIESMPRGMLFWRSFTHWIGGMGVLIFTLALLPRLSGRSAHLARAESPGPTFTKLLPRMSDTAKILYGIYIALSLGMFLILLLCGMNVYDALIHTFSTAGTGGFSNYGASVAAFQSPLIEWVIAAFMLLFGVNFAVYFHLIRKEFKPAVKNEEMLCYFAIALVATLGVTIAILPQYGNFFVSLRYGFFQVTSIMSTTGFATADFNLWPLAARFVLILVMCIGACAGSTGGGFKVSRVALLVKAGYRDLQHTLQPRKVSVVRYDGKPVQESTLSSLGTYLAVYVMLLLLGSLLLSLEAPDLTTAVTSVITCISNVGPGLNAVGPVENFAFYSPLSKFLLSILMLAGRLEIYPILALLAPSVWRKN